MGGAPHQMHPTSSRRTTRSAVTMHGLGYDPEDPIELVESCYPAVDQSPLGRERDQLARGGVAASEAGFLTHVDAIDRAIEADLALQCSTALFTMVRCFTQASFSPWPESTPRATAAGQRP
jgi:hypothetical protein